MICPVLQHTIMSGLNCLVPFFTGTYPDCVFQWQDEYLAVLDASGFGSIFNGFHYLGDQFVVHGYLHLDLRNKIHNVFRASVKLGVSLPAAKSLNLADRDFLDADLIQGILKLIQLERFDYRLYQAS